MVYVNNMDSRKTFNAPLVKLYGVLILADGRQINLDGVKEDKRPLFEFEDIVGFGTGIFVTTHGAENKVLKDLESVRDYFSTKLHGKQTWSGTNVGC